MRGLLVIALCMAACAAKPRWQPSEAMATSARMLKQMEALEADLHQGASETDTYAELVERHAHAEQIACKVTDEHVAEIHRLAVAQEQKLQQKRQARLRKKKVVAQLTPRRAGT